MPNKKSFDDLFTRLHHLHQHRETNFKCVTLPPIFWSVFKRWVWVFAYMHCYIVYIYMIVWLIYSRATRIIQYCAVVALNAVLLLSSREHFCIPLFFCFIFRCMLGFFTVRHRTQRRQGELLCSVQSISATVPLRGGACNDRRCNCNTIGANTALGPNIQRELLFPYIHI